MTARLMLSLLVAVMVSATAPAVAADVYATMMARIKAGDTHANYGTLREAYASSAQYQPYGGDYDEARSAMRKAFDSQDCDAVLSNANKVLDLIYIDIASHLLSASCLEKSGDKEKAEQHRMVARALMNAILKTGDGETARTAYVVVTISEEYDVLHTQGLSVETQALASEHGHVYDRIVAKTEKGDEKTLYFQIDKPMAWMSRTLK